MRAAYYNEIKSKLEAISDIAYVGRWKNQTTNPDTIINTPCALVEMLPVNYESIEQYKQVADEVRFIIHLIFKKWTQEDTEDNTIYDLSQDIYIALQQSYNYERVSEQLDVNNDDLEDFQLTYSINRVVDEDAKASTTTTERPDVEFDNDFKNPDGS
jgi:hypothetical protein